MSYFCLEYLLLSPFGSLQAFMLGIVHAWKTILLSLKCTSALLFMEPSLHLRSQASDRRIQHIISCQEQAEEQEESVQSYLAGKNKLDPFLRLVLAVMHEGSKVVLLEEDVL